MWICRPRALWRTNIAARRFAIGRYAISLDPATRTAVVWAESRKLGQYDARELSVKWPAPSPAIAVNDVLTPAIGSPAVDSRAARAGGACSRSRPKIELLWDSPAAAGHNRTTVFRAPLVTEGDRSAARALDSTLRRSTRASTVPLITFDVGRFAKLVDIA